MAPPFLVRPGSLDFAKETAGQGVSGNRGMIFTPPSGDPSCDPTPGMAPAPAPRGFDVRNSPTVRLLYPPKVLKLGSSQDFKANDYRVILLAGVGTFIEPPTLMFQIPKDQVGWLQQFSLYTLNPSAATYASWSIRINGAPVSGYDNVLNPPGIANLVEVFTNNMAVRLGMGTKVQIRITNVDGSGPWTVGGLLAGWYHPRVAETRAWDIDP